MNKIVTYSLERIKEPSTWRSAVMLVTALGLASAEQGNAILNFGLAMSGLIGAFLPDKI